MKLDLNTVFTFVNVVQEGSFKDASKKMGISRPSVSHHIANLEGFLKIRLLKRGKGGVYLTPEGEKFYDYSLDIINKLDYFEKNLGTRENTEEGDLCITSYYGVISYVLPKYIEEFKEKHPKIRLSLKGDNNLLNYIEDQHFKSNFPEVHIRTSVPDRGDLIQKKIMSFSTHIYAHKRYIDKFGLPKKIDDLDNHRLLTISSELSKDIAMLDWIRVLGREKYDPRPYYVSCNSGVALFKLCEAGLGIACLWPELNELKNPDFVRILPELETPVVDYYCIYPKKFNNINRILSLCSFLQEKLLK